MPTTSVFWPEDSNQDIHLIPGFTGPRLDHLLWIEHTGGNKRADTPPAGVTVTFAANFPLGGPAVGGVAVSASGEVTVTAPLPAPPRLLDFLVIATVRDGAGPAAPTFTAYRRFHIHSSITRTWMTPSQLTVRQATRRSRFDLLAEFDDGSYGNLTAWCPRDAPAAADRTFVRANGSNNPAIVWSAAAGPVTVDAKTGLLTGTGNAGNVAVKADRVGAPAAAAATGTALAAARWTTPITLTPVDGLGFAGLATRKNILFLPDGFTAAQRDDFEQLVRSVVKALGTRQRTRPFDLLRNELNYFMAWVPSREDGISPAEWVERHHVAGVNALATEVDTAVAPPVAGAAWHIDVPLVPGVTNRFLINERDTAFATLLGARPAAQRRTAMRVPNLHPDRFHEDDFDDFLKALRNRANVAVGATWARGGADEDRIVVLCRSNRHGGAAHFRAGSGRLIVMNLDKADSHQIVDTLTGLGKDLRPDQTRRVATTTVWTTAAHELSHSLFLRDEYGGGGPFPAGRLGDAAKSPNVQPRSTLLSGVNLDANRVKWRWPRLRKAGVLTGPPTAMDGGRFRVPLQAGHATAFAMGDVVRFRRRPLLTDPGPSDRFRVTEVPNAAQVIVRPVVPGANPGGYPAGSALICPVRAPDPNPGGMVFGDDLELMHASVRARINATRNPLNARGVDAAGNPLPPNRPCAGAVAFPTPATNFPLNTAPQPPRYSSWIVGLYENGMLYDCDVYHPTGICLMGRLSFVDTVKRDRAYQFCPVCRYAVVDLLDPSQHGAIDADYAPRYPV
ncbi:hypothetical protein JIG36_27575 [Actinoplanes sp. LDG1-06]|uniref:Uncharacterized protein n=1 Tax=Paractinoplanes ovalisporus TaxID=2810368 RepID=A0ABS2AHK7_9ACTN|nr:hypothetical protein [Actinoplanes ovalisporus]MBM2619317.1 hypothetical protein [Actinoplanes ovalisporus]